MLRICLLCLSVLAAPVALAAPADELRKQGEALFRDGKLDEAADAFEQAVELAPNDAAAHHLLGATYGRQAQAASMFGKMRLAGKIKDEFERAVALSPETVEYRDSLFTFYIAAPAVAGGGIDKAKVQAAEIAKRDPVRGDVAYASIARYEDRPDEAVALLKGAYRKRPDDVSLGIQIGIELQGMKRYDEAFAWFQALVAKDPVAMGAWYQLGRTAVLAKAHLAEGEAALKRYLGSPSGGQNPPHAAAHWRLGMIYELMHKVVEARAEYEAALKLDPSHAESKAALKKLK